MRSSKLRFILIGLALSSPICLPFSSIDVYAENDAPRRLILLQKTGTGMKPLRPKAPDRQVVTCAYDGEELHISFVIPEGTATLSVTDETLLTATYQFDTTPLEVTVPVGALQGTVYVEMEASNLNYYTGCFEGIY